MAIQSKLRSQQYISVMLKRKIEQLQNVQNSAAKKRLNNGGRISLIHESENGKQENQKSLKLQSKIAALTPKNCSRERKQQITFENLECKTDRYQESTKTMLQQGSYVKNEACLSSKKKNPQVKQLQLSGSKAKDQNYMMDMQCQTDRGVSKREVLTYKNSLFHLKKKMKSKQSKKLKETPKKIKNPDIRSQSVNHDLIFQHHILSDQKQRQQDLLQLSTRSNDSSFQLKTDLRGNAKRCQFLEKLLQEQKEFQELAKFKAKEMPNFNVNCFLVQKDTKPLTIPDEFQLFTEIRGSQHQQQLQNKIAQTDQDCVKKRQFKAHPLPDFSHPFTPRAQQIHTKVLDLNLHTQQRASEREIFNQYIQDLINQKEEKQRKLQEEMEIQKQKEIQELRKQMEFKAQPIKHYKKAELKLNLKQLTIPEAPTLFADQRITMRTQQWKGMKSPNKLSGLIESRSQQQSPRFSLQVKNFKAQKCKASKLQSNNQEEKKNESNSSDLFIEEDSLTISKNSDTKGLQKFYSKGKKKISIENTLNKVEIQEVEQFVEITEDISQYIDSEDMEENKTHFA